MPLAKIREERARLLRDDDDAALPGSPAARQRASGAGALTYVLYALGGTLYVMLLFVIVNHQQAVRDVIAPIYTTTRSFLDDHLLRHVGLHASIPEVLVGPDGYFAHGVPQLRNTALLLYVAENASHVEFVRDLETMPASMRHGVELRKHDCGHPTAFRICSQYGYNAEIIALHPVLMFWRNSEWSGNFHDSYYEENADVKHTHTEQGRSAHVRAVSAWLRNASKHHHQIVWDRKMLSERVSASRMQAMRSMMAAQVEKEQAETKAAEDEIPDEGAKVEL